MVSTRRCDKLGVCCYFTVFPIGGLIFNVPPVVEKRNNQYITGCALVRGVISKGDVLSSVFRGNISFSSYFGCPR